MSEKFHNFPLNEEKFNKKKGNKYFIWKLFNETKLRQFEFFKTQY
jgi:hypothetical protein